MTFLFIVITLLLYAPGPVTLMIPADKAIKPFAGLIRAIGKVECSYDTLAVNHTEDAWGYFQIRQIRLEDYKKQTGIFYSRADMLDYYKAEKVFMFYAMQMGPYNLELIAKRWNGSGPKTEEYWKKVQRCL